MTVNALVTTVLTDIDSLTRNQLWEAVHATEAIVGKGGHSSISREDIIKAWRAALNELTRRAGARTDL